MKPKFKRLPDFSLRTELIDDLTILVDPHERHAPSRRSDQELDAILSLLDAIETEKEELQ